MRRSALSGPIFQALTFLIGFQRAQWSTRRKATGVLLLLATHRACWKSGAKSLSLLAVSGCSAKPNETSMARRFMGAIIATFRKRFSRGQIVFPLYAPSMIDI
jgi:hypothetical protein